MNQQCNRPGTAPGFDEDDINAERTYWEPSVAPGGLVSSDMVKIKVSALRAKTIECIRRLGHLRGQS